MDMQDELPLQEPTLPQTGPVQSYQAIDASGDQLCQMLGMLESSIEQPVLGSYPGNTLDKLEASIEQQRPTIDYSPDPINEILSQLEKKIESQFSVVPKNEDVLQKTPLMQDSCLQTNRQSNLPFTTPQNSQVFKREPLLHQHPGSTYRMRGHSTGIRNSGNPFDWYCYIHEEWVSKEDCGDCSDFEETDYDFYNESRCKHSFSSSECMDEKEDE